MRASRRGLLGAGGAWIAVRARPVPPALAEAAVAIEMAGRADGSKVWFDPPGLHIAPGRTVRWINRDPVNTHTASAYHPVNGGRPRRMPATAEPWDSGYLLFGEAYSVTLTLPGVYDYYCRPHERAGMVGRIVVGEPETSDWRADGDGDTDLPAAARGRFAPVERIIAEGMVPASAD